MNYNTFLVLLFTSIGSQTLAQCDLSLSVPDDIVICDRQQAVSLEGQISGSHILEFSWTGTNGFFTDQDVITSDIPGENTDYILEAIGLEDANLIVNGDFEAGPVGYTSQYTEVPPPYPPTGLLEGGYYIAMNTPTAWPNVCSFTSNKMICNGAPIPDQLVWCQEIDVEPNTDYLFFADLSTIILPVPTLSFTINGQQIGNNFSGVNTLCEESTFFELWNSGSNTQVTICITNQSTVSSGNDFTLDNLRFSPTCVVRDTFSVIFPEVDIDFLPPEELSCTQPEAQLIPQLTPLGEPYTFFWSTLDGQIVGAETDSIITVSAPGTYTLEVTDKNGCTFSNDVQVFGNTSPPQYYISGDSTLDCATPEVTLSAIPENNLQSDIISIVWISPSGQTQNGFSIRTSEAGQHTVIMVNEHLCPLELVVNVSNEFPNFDYNVSRDSLLCEDTSAVIRLSLRGSYEDISWQGPAIEQIYEDSILVSGPGTYSYRIRIMDDCFITDSVEIVALRPYLTIDSLFIQSPNCRHPLSTVKLFTSGKEQDIIWQSRIDSTVVFGDSVSLTSGIYDLIIVDTIGCIYYDSIDIVADTSYPQYEYEKTNINCTHREGAIRIFADSMHTIQWWYQGNPYSMENQITDLGAGDYVVQLTSSNNCTRFDTIQIAVDTLKPSLTLVPDTLNCTKDSVQIQYIAEPGLLPQWIRPGQDTLQQDVLFTTVPGTFQLQLLDTMNQCFTIDSIFIPIDTIRPAAFITADSTISCSNRQSEIHVRKNNSSDSISIFFASDFITSDSIYQAQKPGSYVIEILNQRNGCRQSYPVTIEADTLLPMVDIVFDDITCKNPTATIELSSDLPGVQYLFLSNNVQQSGPQTYTTRQAGLYILQYEGQNGCVDSLPFRISIDTLSPKVQVSDLETSCDEPRAPLDLMLQQGFTFYLLQHDSFQITSFPSSPLDTGRYVYRVEDTGNGCVYRNSFEVHVPEKPSILNVLVDLARCYPETHQLQEIIVKGGAPDYVVEYEGKKYPISSPVSLAYGENLLRVSDQNGCVVDTLLTLPILEEYRISSPIYLEIDAGQELVLDVPHTIPDSSILDIVWTPSTGLSCTDCLHPAVELYKDQAYQVQITTLKGCMYLADVILKVQFEKGIYLPNIFSPNQDGVNDFFYPTSLKNSIDIISDFKIYDRWGELVFENQHFLPNVSSEGWNGYFRQRKASEGVYTYRIVVTYIDGTWDHKIGTITLVR